jgi:hypothetical protein
MNRKKLRAILSDYNPEAILFDNLDDAVIGIGQQHGMNSVAIYDSILCIKIFKEQFMKDNPEMTEEEAEMEAAEWFEYNVESAFVGPNTPIFMDSLEDYE